MFGRPDPPVKGQRGPRRKKGERLATPKAMIEDTTTYPAELLDDHLPEVDPGAAGAGDPRHVLWYRGSKTDPVAVVLVRDPLGQWRDEALVTTDPTCLGGVRDPGILPDDGAWSWRSSTANSTSDLHDPRVRSERSVERAHPMAWFLESLVILWYCVDGHRGSQVERDRPWYTTKVTPTFTDMLGAVTVADVGA